MNLNKLINNLFTKHDKPNSHHSSSITQCLRKLYYKWTEAEQTNPPTISNYIKMDFGSYAENLIERALIHACENNLIDGYSTQEKKHIDIGLKYPLAVMYDFMFYNHKRGKFLIECKSSFGHGIRRLQKSNDIKEDHLVQIGLYMKHFNTEKTILYYISRDDGYMVQYYILWDESELIIYDVFGRFIKTVPFDYQLYIDKLKKLELHVEEEIVPQREYYLVIDESGKPRDKMQRNKVIYKSDWQCYSYCQYRDLCWELKND